MSERDEEGKWNSLFAEARDAAHNLTQMEEKVARAQKEVEQARKRASEASLEEAQARADFKKRWGREPQLLSFYPS